MPADFQRVKDIFLAAAEQTDPREREACLRQACGDDDALRRRVEVLLRRHDQANSILERPAFDAAAIVAPQSAGTDDPAPQQEAAGTRLGPYKLLQKIGEGGMGTVWMAEQQEPVRRLVALKVIRTGLDSAQGVARFEAERQALALMDHPNIAKILDAGVIGEGGRVSAPSPPGADATGLAGRPYFVMELVKGTPITRYCDEHRLTPRQRLELFIPVCRALQHAHQKGIIHRDIKPSNVLVAPYDGRPVVKVIDFGVAKTAGPRLTERTLYTEFGTMIGTLEYMSPEQAELNNQDIDTRSDIYSLGVLLYELLTGTTPLTAERLKKSAFLELLRAIREEEPPRPSTRLSDSKEALPSISAQRQTEPAKLRKLLRGELDWIVMKALEKDRNGRYETANGLARDVERHLNDETVEACPPSPGYRLRKLLRRYKGRVAAAGGILAALMLGLVGTLIFAMGEAEQRGRAEQNARVAEEKKTAALRQAYRARIAAATAALHGHDVVDAARELDEAPEPLRGWEWLHLHSRLDESSAVWRPPAGSSLGLINSPEGLRLSSITGTDLRLTDEEGRECLALSLRLFRGIVSFAPKRGGLWVVDVDEHQTLRLLDEAGKVRLSADGRGKGGARVLAVNPDPARLAVDWWGSPQEFGIELFGTASSKPYASCVGHTNRMNALAFSPDGTQLASASEDGTARLWDPATGAVTAVLRGHTVKVYHVAFRPDGARVLTTSADGTVRRWDTRTGKEEIYPYQGHTGEVYTAAFSPDGEWIASGGADRTVRLWRAAGRQEAAVWHGHTGAVRSLAFSADGRRLASTGEDGTVRVWEVDPGASLPVLRGHTSFVYPVAYSPAGRWIASGSWDHTVRLWDALTGEECAKLPHTSFVRALAFSPDSSWLVSGCDQNDRLHIWDVATGRRRKVIQGPGPILQALAVSPGGTRIAAVDRDGHLSILDATTGKAVASLRMNGSFERKELAYSPDGRWLAGTGEGKRISLWDTQTNQLAVTLAGHGGDIYSVAFSPDGRRLVSTSQDRTVRVWDLGTATCQAILSGHTNEVFTAVFHPDGTRIASAGRDRAIWLWDVTTAGEEKVVARLQGHTDYVFSLAFSPDGKTLVSGSGDTTVRLWDTEPLRDRQRARREAEALRP